MVFKSYEASEVSLHTEELIKNMISIWHASPKKLHHNSLFLGDHASHRTNKMILLRLGNSQATTTRDSPQSMFPTSM